MQHGEEIARFTSSAWCEQSEQKTSTLHITRDESPISIAYCISYNIFHNTDT